MVASASALAVILGACTAEPAARVPSPSASAPPTTSASSPVATPDPSCPPIEESVVTGTVSDPALDEISGVAVGRRLPGVLWVQEDSGNDAAVFALRPTGAVVARVDVVGASNVDWEDLAWAMGRLWIADIGDNGRGRREVQIYPIPEPRVRGATRATATVLRLRYEDGPHDAEAMFVDARDERLYIVVKQLSDPTSAVYAIPLAQVRAGAVGVLRRVTSVPVSTVTAADLGPAGIVIRNYLGTQVFPWAEDRSVVSTLAGTPCLVSLGASEAVAQTPDGSGIYSIPEGVRPSIRYSTV